MATDSKDFGDYLKQLEGLISGTSAPAPSKPDSQPAPAPSAVGFDDYLSKLRNMIVTPGPSKPDSQAAPVPAPAPAPTPAPAPIPEPSAVGFDDYLSKLRNMIVTPAPSKPDSQAPPAPSKPDSQAAPVKKLKFMLVSTHCHQVTGYSKVSYGLIQELAKQSFLDVTHYGFQRMANKDFSDTRSYPANVKVIDAAALEKPAKQGFGYEQLASKIQEVKPDVIMIYNDMAVITQFMEHIKKSGIKRDFATWLYVDQVYAMQLAGYIEVINREADRVFAFTQGWKDCLKEQGVHRPIDIIHHGFDSKMFYSVPKKMARGKLGLPDDLILITSLNRNQPRKRYDLIIMAFVELIVKYPTKPIALMCVCDKGEKGGWWLFEIFVRELKTRGVPIDRFANRLMVTQREMDYKDEEINAFYNAADIGISAADGEGWGLCTFEQMGVGVPQVVPAVGGYKEFCKPDNSVLVKPKNRYYLPMAFCPVGGEAEAVDPHDLCLGLEQYINDSKLREKHGLAAKEAVAKYTWEASAKGLIRRLKTKWEDDE